MKSRKQAIAIGLSEARKKGAKVPEKESSIGGKCLFRAEVITGAGAFVYSPASFLAI